MTQEAFEERCQRIREAMASSGRRAIRDRSPLQTVLTADREVYEFVRAWADARHIPLKAALTEIMRPVMRAAGAQDAG